MTDQRLQYTEDLVGAGHPTKTDTMNRLALVEHNSDGTHKTLISGWYKPSLTFTYVSSTSFTVNGDQTDIYKPTRRLKINLTSSTVYSEVESATYSSPNTTVQINDAVLTSSLVDVEHSLFKPTKDNGALTPEMLNPAFKTISAATTLSVNDHIIHADTSTTGFTITLPTAASAGAGKEYIIKNTGSAGWPVTVAGNGSETVDGVASVILKAKDETLIIYCDGSNWRRKVFQSINKNYLINGNFDIWQRGTTFNIASAGNAYTADRWRSINASGPTSVVSRGTFGLGTAYPPDAKYDLIWAITQTGVGGNTLWNKIEGVRTLAGKTVTVSFWASNNVGSSNLTVYLRQYFGTGGSPSANVDKTAVITTDTTMKKYVVTLTLDSLSGKTIGTDGNDSLQFILSEQYTGSITFYIAQVKVEEGPVPTPFEPLSYQEELEACKRYYQKTYSPETAPGTTTAASWIAGMGLGVINRPMITWQLPVSMRGTPSIAAYSQNTGTIGKCRDVTAGIDMDVAVQDTGLNHVTVNVSGATPPLGNLICFHLTVDSEL